MNAADLRDVLEERSRATDEDIMHHLRLSGVRTRVRRRRRRRVAAWSAAVLVTLAGIGALAVQPSTPPADPAPATTPMPAIKGFPEYANGARVVAAEVATVPIRRVELTVVLDQALVTVFTRCAERTAAMSLTINARPLVSGSCGGAVRSPDWVASGLRVGQPNTFVMELTTGGGEFGLAVGEAVPFADYPLPPRPARLAPVPDPMHAGCVLTGCTGEQVVRSDAAAPLRPQTVSLPGNRLGPIDLFSQTPGVLRVRIDGTLVGTGEWWDYEAGLSTISVPDEVRADARTVTIEIVPEHVTGAWAARIGTLDAPRGS